MKTKDVELFDRFYSQIDSLYAEIGVLSKKSPNDVVNKFKLKFINTALEEANKILKEKYKPFEDFETFEEDNLPTNSDVTLILAQYLSSLEELRAANISVEYGDWYWVIDGRRSKIETYPPKKLRG